MPFGPDNNLEMDFTRTYALVVPPQQRAIIDFSSQAAWENAVCIYQLGQADNKIAERGNYSRTLARWDSGVNTGLGNITFLISGWHKNSPPAGNKPWYQSPGKVVLQTALDVVFGFEDGADGDYNDIVAFIKRNPSSL